MSGPKQDYGLGTGETPALLRLPAVRYKDEMIALDGNHSLKFRNPQIIVVDYLSCRNDFEATCFADLNPAYFL